jgi:hypothetical protein
VRGKRQGRARRRLLQLDRRIIILQQRGS